MRPRVLQFLIFFSAKAEHMDVGADAVCRQRRMLADNAIAEHQDLTVAHVQDAGKLHALAAVDRSQVITAYSHRHIAGNGAHGREQRKAVRLVLHGLIGDGGGVRRQQRTGQFCRDAGQVQVGEQEIPPQVREFRWLGFLDLQYQLRIPGARRVHYLCARGLVGRIGKT